MSILIGADIVPTQSNIDLFKAGDIESLLGSGLIECLNNADYRIFNIEAPITDIHEPIPKCGLNLQVPSACIKGLSAMRIDLVTLANNHILDQGEKGLFDTQKHLEEEGINHVGTGTNTNAARKPFVFLHNGKKIGVFACAEHEFSIATNNSAGANPFDSLESPDDVYRLKQECDYVIVLYHGGKEFYRYPSPFLQKTCRKLIEKGANLVICQHSHCIGCEEHYNNGIIIYGQGNFIFDSGSDEYWNSGILVSIDESFEIQYYPIVKNGNGVRLANEYEKTELMTEFYERSKQALDPQFVNEKYARFAKEKVFSYLHACAPADSVFIKLINKLTRGKYQESRLRRQFNRYNAARVLNYIECEAHQELFLRGLKDLIDE